MGEPRVSGPYNHNHRVVFRMMNRRMISGRRGTRSLMSARDSVLRLSPFARWRADTGITTDVGVSVWTDMVSGRTLTAGATQPTLVSSVAERGGHPAIRFDGAAAYMASDDAASTWSFGHNGTGREAWCSMVIREALPISGATRIVVGTMQTSSTVGWSMQIPGGGSTIRQIVGNGSAAIVTAATSSATQNTGYWSYASYKEGDSPEATAAAEGLTSGTQASTAAPSASDPISTLSIGAGWNGSAYAGFALVDIAELVVFNRTLSVSERASMTAYMTGRYS